MQDIIKQWPILSLLPLCKTDAGLSIVRPHAFYSAGRGGWLDRNQPFEQETT